MSKKEWFGVVPTNWDVIRGRFLFRQSTEKGNKNLVLLSATQDKGIVDKNTLEGVVQVSQNADLMQFKTVHKDDFVISLRSFQGGFEYSAIEGVISPAYSVFRLTPSKFPHYFRHLFKSDTFISKLNSLTTGIREGKNIQYFDFSNILLPVPPIITQQQIANFLDEKCADIDQLITLQQQMIDELKAYKQSVITEAVCKGLDKSVPMKDSGIEWIGEVPEGWEILPISKIGKVSSSKRVFEEEYTDKGIPFFRSKEVSELSGGLDTSTEIFISEQTYSRVTKISSAPKIGDMLLTSIGTIGKTWIADGRKFYYKDGNLTQISSEEWNNTKYIQYCFKSNIIIEQYNRLSVGSTLLALTMVKIKNMILTYPPLEEQSIIVKYLDKKCSQIDTLISIKQQKIEELKEYKKSMIYEYITGKKQVPNN